jgi:oligopeptide transport system substrate-binding protein
VNGRWSVMTQVLPPAMPGYDPAIKGYAYNPRLAKKLLKQAGYAHGINNLTYVYTSGRPFTTEVAEAIQQQLAAVGIHVRLKNIADTSSYWSYSADPKNYNIAWTDWWQDYPDPEDFMFNLLDKSNIGGLNNSEWTNPTFEKDITTADTLPASQDQLRWKLYDQAEQIWYREAPWVPLFYPYIDAIIQPYVGPNDLMVYLHPVLTPQFQYMFINKSQ